MLKKKPASKLGALSLASKLKRKKKRTVPRKALFATIAGAGAAIIGLGRATKGRDAR